MVRSHSAKSGRVTLTGDHRFAVAFLLGVTDLEILRAEDALEPVAADIRRERNVGQELVHRAIDLILMRQGLIAVRIIVQLEIVDVILCGFFWPPPAHPDKSAPTMSAAT